MTVQPASTLKNRSFTFFTGTQYLGAFNDNVYKQMVLLFSLEVMRTGDRQGLATIIFALPFILFSGYAGQISEMYSKTTIMRLSKVAELVIMLLAALGFLMRSEAFLLAVLFLMGAQSTFFGPAKYGVIPEIVEDKILIDANGIVQMTTMLAIILGQAMAGWLVDTYRESLAVAGIYCAVIALLGVGTVYLIRGTGANRPEMRLQLNPFGRIWTSLREMAADKPLFLALIGGSFFFFSGAMVTLTVNNYGVNLLGLTAGGTSMLLVRLAFGIMIGCLVTGPIQRRIGGKWTIFLGAVGVAASEFALYFYGAPRIMIHLFLFSAGFFTGLYYVPIATFMQSRPKLGKKGEILAAYNFSNFVSILLAGVVWQLLMTFKISAHYAWWGLTGMLILLLVFMFPHLKRID